MDLGGRIGQELTIWKFASGKEAFTLPAHDSNIRDAAFTRDSRGIIGNADLSPVLWSLKPKDLPDVDVASVELWEALASEDGKKVYRLLWALANDPKRAIALFNERIKPAELAMPRNKYDKLLANLDHPQFRVREAAERDLTKAGS